MALVDSLLTAMVRANGDALVMHVGERPYVVTGTGTIDLSTHGLNLEAMTGMLAQLLPADLQNALQEFGAIEHQLPSFQDDRFTVVAARGGDDIWIEIRRRRHPGTAAVAAAPAPVEVAPAAAVVTMTGPEPAPDVSPVVVDEAPLVIDEAPLVVDDDRPVVEEVAVAVDEVPAAIEDTPATAIDDRFVIEAPMAIDAETLALEHALAEAVRPAFMVPMPETAQVEPAEPAAPVLASVLPMTRTVRNEAPHRAAPARVAGVERLLRLAASRGASSLFLTPGSRPYLRVDGDIRQFEAEPVLSKADVEAAMLEIGPENAGDLASQAEWIVELPEVGRVRCTTFVDHHGPGLIFNMIATRAATAEQLGLVREMQTLATEAEGLVLVAGSRGSGKSTIMSALVDLVNRQRADYVITLERQIRLVHENRSGLVSQREIRGGADETLSAARAALRENPDVLVVDDLSSPQMVPLLLQAASEGLLVFVSITAPSTTDAVERWIDLAPPESRKAVQTAMAETFRGAIAQVLLKKTGGGRVAAREVLLGTASVTRLIAEGQMSQLPLALESGRKHGMMPMTDALLGFVQSGAVDVREAFRKTPDRDRLIAGLRRQGIDTSVVERLA